MKKYKRILALLLCVMLCLSLIPAMAFADGTALNQDEAVDQLRSDLLAHSSQDVLAIKLTEEQSDDPDARFRVLMSRAWAHIGVTQPEAGDYLQYHLQSYKTSITAGERIIDTTGTYYVFSFTVNFTYTMTADQAAELDGGRFQEIYNSLNLSEISDAQTKVQTIYRYLRENVYFNPVVDYSTEYVRDTAYGALVNQEADTLGIALAFYRMALTAGVDARVVEGEDADYNEVYWNLVQLDGTWYIVNAASAYSDYLCSRDKYDIYDWQGVEDLYSQTSETRYGGSVGDVNSDGTVDQQDLPAFRSYLAGSDDVSVNERAADMNDDGYANLYDLLLLKHQLADG